MPSLSSGDDVVEHLRNHHVGRDVIPGFLERSSGDFTHTRFRDYHILEGGGQLLYFSEARDSLAVYAASEPSTPPPHMCHDY